MSCYSIKIVQRQKDAEFLCTFNSNVQQELGHFSLKTRKIILISLGATTAFVWMKNRTIKIFFLETLFLFSNYYIVGAKTCLFSRILIPSLKRGCWYFYW